MAGLAFLPWEKWIARLVHSLVVWVRRRLHLLNRKRELKRSEGWPETEGTILSINWDSSNPREEIAYTYSTAQGLQSGFHWRWFDLDNIREVRSGDHVTLRYNPQHHDESIFLNVCGNAVQVSQE